MLKRSDEEPKTLSLKKIKFIASKEHQNQRLDQVLAMELAKNTPISKSQVRKLIIAGAVYLNGRRVKIASKPVMLNAQIELMVDFEKLSQKQGPAFDRPYELLPADVLYEDSHLIEVNKPSGLPTQATLDQSRNHLFLCVQKYLKGSYVGLHHRLDRDTSGVVLFTKVQSVNKAIGDLFQNHEIQKTYIAISKADETRKDLSALKQESIFTVKNFLAPVGKGSGKTKKFGAVHSGGDPALTDFQVLSRDGSILKIQARPKTGRTHQIRVHLSEMGLPIIGDRLYSLSGSFFEPPGSNAVRPSRLLLHAWRLEFLHPVTNEKVRIEAPLPIEFKMECK